MIEIFNNREISLFAWGAVILIWVTLRHSTREALLDILKTVFVGKLGVLWLTIILYTTVIVYGLYKLNIWNVSQLKNTTFWLFTVGLVSLFDVTNPNKENYFKLVLKDIFNFTAILQFIIGIYSFNFFIELLLVPVAILIVGMIVAGERNPKHKQVVGILNTLLSLFGMFLILYTVYRIIKDFSSFANTGTVSDFFVPAALSFLFIPFIYILSIYVNHEDTFTGLKRKIKDRKLLRFAKWQALINFHIHKKDLKRWRTLVFARELKSKDDIRHSISFLKELRKVESAPPEITFDLDGLLIKQKNFYQSMGLKQDITNLSLMMNGLQVHPTLRSKRAAI